jgi:hypothetical protein
MRKLDEPVRDVDSARLLKCLYSLLRTCLASFMTAKHVYLPNPPKLHHFRIHGDLKTEKMESDQCHIARRSYS